MITLNNQPIQIQHFPDGTQKLNCDMNLIHFNTFPALAEITWYYENEAEAMTLYYLNAHLREAGVEVVILNMPYIPNARFDRVKDKDEIFTLKYFARFINSMGFNSVTVYDPHSYVSEALIDHLIIRTPEDMIRKVLTEYISKKESGNTPVLFFPDEGAIKRYSHMASKFHTEFAFGMKNRDWKTGVIKNLTLTGDTEAIKNRPVLIIDDICSKGGTFYHSAKALLEAGASKVYLYITHCENTILDGEMIQSDMIDHVYTTNSIFTKEHPKITVLSI